MNNPFEQIDLRLASIEALLCDLQARQPAPTQAPQAPEIIDRKELCNRLGITQPSLIRWEKKGKIPTMRVGGSIRYNWLSVVEALEKNKGGVR